MALRNVQVVSEMCVVEVWSADGLPAQKRNRSFKEKGNSRFYYNTRIPYSEPSPELDSRRGRGDTEFERDGANVEAMRECALTFPRKRKNGHVIQSQ